MWGMASDMVSRKWRPQIDTPAYECQLKVRAVGSGCEKAGFQVAADRTVGSSAPRRRSKTARGNAPRIGAIVVPEP
jgi:hypothetical protein